MLSAPVKAHRYINYHISPSLVYRTMQYFFAAAANSTEWQSLSSHEFGRNVRHETNMQWRRGGRKDAKITCTIYYNGLDASIECGGDTVSHFKNERDEVCVRVQSLFARSVSASVDRSARIVHSRAAPPRAEIPVNDLAAYRSRLTLPSLCVNFSNTRHDWYHMCVLCESLYE